MKASEKTPDRELTFAYFKQDLQAGLIVFLIALPLCLGIALASGAPLFSGIVSGIIGGAVVAFLSGSQLAVSGPAAGLTVIILSAIEKLGSFEAFLVAVVICGVLQLVLGFVKAGIVSDYFPSSVIKGMLAAIGIILIIKQIPYVIGKEEAFFEGISFIQLNKEVDFFTTIIDSIHFGALSIAVVSLLILTLWPSVKSKFLLKIPAPLLAVFSGVCLNQLFLLSKNENWYLSTKQLVSIPVASGLADFATFLTLPDWSALAHVDVYIIAITLAVVASLETLLSVKAIDKLDVRKRTTPTNRELKAQGIGNILSGLIGGLPMTAVIVRGSVNINSGAQTKLAAFIHGMLLFLAVLFFARWINYIPYASLAAILLVTGYKLANAGLFKQMWKTGKDQFVPFIITIIAILLTDLLVGIGVGMAVGIIFILKRNMENSHIQSYVEDTTQRPITLLLSEEVSFLNKANVMLFLEKVPEDRHLIIDASKSYYIDPDVIEAIYEFVRETAPYKNIKVDLINIERFIRENPLK